MAYKAEPEGFTDNPYGLLAANGDPATGVRTPFEPILNTAMLFPAWLATKTNRPALSTATAVGRDPVVKGDPGTAVNIPLTVLTENADRLLAIWLLTRSSLCTGSKAMNSAPAPAANGEPAIVERAPLLLIIKAETVPEPELVTKAKLVLWAVGVAVFFMEPQPDKPRARITKRMMERGVAGEIIRTISGRVR